MPWVFIAEGQGIISLRNRSYRRFFIYLLAGRYARGKRPREGEENVEHRHRRSSSLPFDQPLGAHDQRPLLEAPQEWRLPSLQTPHLHEQHHRALDVRLLPATADRCVNV